MVHCFPGLFNGRDGLEVLPLNPSFSIFFNLTCFNFLVSRGPLSKCPYSVNCCPLTWPYDVGRGFIPVPHFLYTGLSTFLILWGIYLHEQRPFTSPTNLGQLSENDIFLFEGVLLKSLLVLIPITVSQSVRCWPSSQNFSRVFTSPPQAIGTSGCGPINVPFLTSSLTYPLFLFQSLHCVQVFQI